VGRRWTAREIAGTGAVIGSIVALGYALAGVPNVELCTLTSFLGGWLLGAARGALAGGTGMFFFSLFNPLGPALPPVHVAQTAGMALAGASGGWLSVLARRHAHFRRRLPGEGRPSAAAPFILGATGAALTLVYDAATNAGHAVAMNLVRQMPSVIAAGVAFAALHIVTNAALFAVLGPAALFLVERHRGP
jgi:hypothetical protein